MDHINFQPIEHSEIPLKLKYKGINKLDDLFDFQYNYVHTLYKNCEIIGGHTQKVDKNIIRHILIKKDNSWINIKFDITDILKKLSSQSKRNKDRINQLEKDITIPETAIQKEKKN